MWRQWRSGIHEQRRFSPGPDPWIPGRDIHRSISVIKIVHSFKGMNRTEVSCWVKFAFRQAGLVSKISLKSTVTVIILSVKGLHLISKIREYHIIWCPYNGLYNIDYIVGPKRHWSVIKIKSWICLDVIELSHPRKTLLLGSIKRM